MTLPEAIKVLEEHIYWNEENITSKVIEALEIAINNLKEGR